MLAKYQWANKHRYQDIQLPPYQLEKESLQLGDGTGFETY